MGATLSTSASHIPPQSAPPGLPHLLVVDGSEPVRGACGSVAVRLGFTVGEAHDAGGAREILRRRSPDLLLLDLEIAGDARALIAETRRLHPRTRVAVMTEFSTVQTAVDCMRLGAGDYLPKPFTVDELAAVLARSGSGREDVERQSQDLRKRLETPSGMGELVGRTPEMEKLYRILSKVAFTNHPVLIVGESGTGKELLARSIHFNGPNAERPFLLVDCSATDPGMLEAELFGRSSSLAISPAPGILPAPGISPAPGTLQTPGMLSSPEGATVLLDEVADLPPDLQARLLRALQDKEVRLLGSVETLPLTARVLAATARNLSALVDSGRFRKDLFYRLNVVNLKIPPLRDRPADIPVLARHFLARLERETGATLTLSDDTLHLMEAYDWPGNVRELETAMERGCALTSGPILHLGDLPTQLQEFRNQRDAELAPPIPTLPDPGDPGIAANGEILPMAEIERQVILKTLRQLNGDKLTAARLLGIGKTTLYRKLKEYGLDEEETANPA